jgi:hypothetical protein
MYKSYKCVKEENIDIIENKIIRLETNYTNTKEELIEIKKTQKLIIQLIISGLVGLLIEIVGLMVGLIVKFFG